MMSQNINGMIFLGILLFITVILLLLLMNSLNKHYRRITDEYINLLNIHSNETDKFLEIVNAIKIIAIALTYLEKETKKN